MGLQISENDSNNYVVLNCHFLPDHPLPPPLSWVPWAHRQD